MSDLSDDEFAAKMRRARRALKESPSAAVPLSKALELLDERDRKRQEEVAEAARRYEEAKQARVEEAKKSFDASKPFVPRPEMMKVLAREPFSDPQEQPIEVGDFPALHTFNAIAIKKAFVDPMSDKRPLLCSRDVIDYFTEVTPEDDSAFRVARASRTIWLEGTVRPRPFVQMTPAPLRGGIEPHDIIAPPDLWKDWSPLTYSPDMHRSLILIADRAERSISTPTQSTMNVLASIRSGAPGEHVLSVISPAAYIVQAVELIGLRGEVIDSFPVARTSADSELKDRMWEIVRKRFSIPSIAVVAKIEVSSFSHRLKVGLQFGLL